MKVDKKLYIKKFFTELKAWFLKSVKSAVVKSALIALLKTPIATGFKGWLVKFIVENLFDSVAKPVILLSLRKTKRLYWVIDGKKIVARLDLAHADDDQDSYDDALDDLLS